ncbi:hypothetical protein GEMRC1_012448 [Eukaryota sp. GEM-RC1]
MPGTPKHKSSPAAKSPLKPASPTPTNRVLKGPLSVSSITSPPIARLHPECLSALSIYPGDFLKLQSSSSDNYVIIRVFPDQSTPFGHCKLDQDTCRDLGSTTASPTASPTPNPLSQFSIVPSSMKSSPSPSFHSLLMTKLIGRVVRTGSTLSFNFPPFFSSDNVFTVTSDCEGIITPQTSMEFNPSQSAPATSSTSPVLFAGYSSLTEEVSALLSLSLHHASLFDSLSFGAPRTVLITGHFGVGKKQLVKYLSQKFSSNFTEIHPVQSKTTVCDELDRLINQIDCLSQSIILIADVDQFFLPLMKQLVI